jgi:general stress protein 26
MGWWKVRVIVLGVTLKVLRGTMEVLTDAASKQMIWREGDTEYYPGGVTDPNYCVLKFTATDGRFYSDYFPRSFVIE